MVPVVISSSRSCNPEIGRVAPENSRYDIRCRCRGVDRIRHRALNSQVSGGECELEDHICITCRDERELFFLP